MTAVFGVRRWANFFRHRWWEQLAFMPTWLLLGIAKLAICTLSFERVAAGLGTSLGPHAFVPLGSASQSLCARRISRLVLWVARYTPWDSDCFPQALVARFMLGLGGVPWALCFGLERGADELMQAHAWVVCGRVNVTGGASFGRYAVVACFTSLSEAQLARAP